MSSGYNRLKYACYTTNVCLSIVSNLSPILFLTFRSLYGISYSLLGLLVLVNFVTQLCVDLIFSFFSHKFNISKAVKVTPLLAGTGFLIYAVWPWLFPNAVYAGLLLGTIVFSASGGFVEVLLSPVITAIPSENPDRELSKLHSMYAWGVVGFIIVATLFLLAAGQEHWQVLVLMLTLIPVAACILFINTTIPEAITQERVSGISEYSKNKELWICVIMIFLAGATECAMAQWSSGYLEQAVGLPKVWGDILGVALFAVLEGLGRTLYAKRGKNIYAIMFVGTTGATVCYLLVALCNIPVIGLLACAVNGFCVSMLWPGSLQIAGHRFPAAGVFLYALLAAGGDLGVAIGPQLMGIVTDVTMKMPGIMDFAVSAGLTPEQIGMKMGMLVGALFPLAAMPLYYRIWKKWKCCTEV